MSSKKLFIVMMVLVITIFFLKVIPAFSQIEEVKQAWEADPYDRFGHSVSGGYDLDGDGTSDLIVGAPYSDFFGKVNAGRVCIFSGADGDTICVIDGESSGDLFGYSISSSGDLNNDSKPDFIVGAPGYSSNTGKVYIYSGQTFSLLHTFTGESAGDKFGFSVSGAGDANADGCKDLIVGAPGASWGARVNCGKIYLYRGCTWIQHWDDHGEASYDSLGYSVSGGCDVNNDAYDDVIVGAPYVDEGLKVDRGRVYALSGNNPTPALCWSTGGDSYDYLGWSVSCVGYFNTNSYADFVVGAPGYNNSTGAAYVFEVGLALCDTLCKLYGAASGDLFGWSVSGAGDVNNDGRADVVIGAPGVSSYKGKAYIYLGGCSFQCSVLGRNQGDRFGYSVASAGDVAAGDNKDDVIIGAPSANVSGKAYVQSGVDCSEIFQFYPVYPGIVITSPSGGEKLCEGKIDTIRWSSHLINGNVRIDYSTNGGGNWINITTGTQNDGQYEWTIPSAPSQNCLVKICGTKVCESVTMCDTSNIFSIIEPNITIISPIEGELWCEGSNHNIRWTSDCLTNGIKIDYSTNNGGSWISLVASTENDGIYEWLVPHTPSSSCLVKVCDVDGSPCDTSGRFTILDDLQCPVLTNYGIIVLLILLVSSAIWMMRRKKIITQRHA